MSASKSYETQNQAAKRRAKTARAIADLLFIEPYGKRKADRLEVKFGVIPNERSGGGWCWHAVVDQVEVLLNKLKA